MDFLEHAVVAIPTKSDFRGINIREALLIRGTQGWSEFSPFVEYEDAESSTWLKAAIAGAYRPWPKLMRTSVAINATLPRIAPEQVAEFMANYPGCTTVKMKVYNFEDDADRLEALLDFAPDAKVRLDVNGGWSLAQARTYIHDYFMRFGSVFEYIEQPCTDLSDIAELKKEIPIKIALDESIRKYINSDLSHISELADIAIMKWAPSGGIESARRIIDEIGLPTVISSALDTGIGISHGLALAGSLPDLDYACGLGTTALLIGDIADPSPRPIKGEIEVKRLTPTPELLRKFAASPERTIWWENRVERIWKNQISDEVKGWVQ
jgi:O-succinylbenzoate synthase